MWCVCVGGGGGGGGVRACMRACYHWDCRFRLVVSLPRVSEFYMQQLAHLCFCVGGSGFTNVSFLLLCHGIMTAWC